MEGERIEIVIEAEVVAIEATEDEDIAVEFYYMAVVLLAIAASSAFYILRGKNPEEQSEGPILVPIDGINNEGAEPIEPENDFGIVSGSEFSRQVVFVCENGCQKEFTGDGEEEEIMCPHCGMIGDSPL